MTKPRKKPKPSGVAAPKGFTASGIHVGIKDSPSLDLALIFSDVEGPIGGVFTKNRIQAAPIQLNRKHLKTGKGQAIIVNSGNANAFTGTRGEQDTSNVATQLSRHLKIPVQSVYVGSTGVIGHHLPMKLIVNAIPSLIQSLSPQGGEDAARAIMTTDTVPKQMVVQGRIGKSVVTIGGMAKGSGMIHPNMATMLAFLTTDARVSQSVLQRTLRKAVDRSFNCISVDGDTSTNDMVLCLANGRADNPRLHSRSPHVSAFQRLLNQACHTLALQICQDGEGATKMVHILVQGAKNDDQAKKVANTVGTSLLVKTAVFGEDANWGRIVAAVGRSGVAILPERLELAFNDTWVVKKGKILSETTDKKLSKILKNKHYVIRIGLGIGNATHSLWTTDLSYDYVKINASYRS